MSKQLIHFLLTYSWLIAGVTLIQLEVSGFNVVIILLQFN